MSDNNLTNEYFDKVHKYTMDNLIFIDSICKEYDIKYTLDCGTLIGAVRENGFIPWDDDSDIGFTRKNFEKFKLALKSYKIPDYIKIYYPEEQDHFYDFILRIYNTKEKIRDGLDNKNSYGGLNQYAITDIYVYDNLPDKKLNRIFYILKLKILFGLALSKRYSINYKKYSFINRVGAFILSRLGKNIDLKQIISAYHDAATRYDEENTESVYCTSWKPEYPGYIYKKIFFDKYVYVDFQDKKFSIVEDYDDVLKIGYGDYMTPIKSHYHDDIKKITN